MKLPIALVSTIGILIITAHNLLDPYVGTLISRLRDDGLGALWKILYLSYL